jgi:hypothetical protein
LRVFDSKKQSFAEQVSRWPLASSKANQSPIIMVVLPLSWVGLRESLPGHRGGFANIMSRASPAYTAKRLMIRFVKYRGEATTYGLCPHPSEARASWFHHDAFGFAAIMLSALPKS